MTTKGIFYVVLVFDDKFERLSPMITSASNARKEFDNIMRDVPPSYKKRVQLIQFVSV